jgi:hypothetical protein
MSLEMSHAGTSRYLNAAQEFITWTIPRSVMWMHHLMLRASKLLQHCEIPKSSSSLIILLKLISIRVRVAQLFVRWKTPSFVMLSQ